MPTQEDNLRIVRRVIEEGVNARDIEVMLAVEDKVVTRYVLRRTHRGEYTGAKPTGKEVAFTGINIVRLEGGKVVESWGNSDQLGWVRQIGVVPAEISF